MLSLLSQDSTQSQKKRANDHRNKGHGIISGFILQQKERKFFSQLKIQLFKEQNEKTVESNAKKSCTPLVFC